MNRASIKLLLHLRPREDPAESVQAPTVAKVNTTAPGKIAQAQDFLRDLAEFSRERRKVTSRQSLKHLLTERNKPAEPREDDDFEYERRLKKEEWATQNIEREAQQTAVRQESHKQLNVYQRLSAQHLGDEYHHLRDIKQTADILFKIKQRTHIMHALFTLFLSRQQEALQRSLPTGTHLRETRKGTPSQQGVQTCHLQQK